MNNSGSKLSVLHLYHSPFANGGVESIIKNICSGASVNKISFNVLTTSYLLNMDFAEELNAQGIPVYSLNKSQKSFIHSCISSHKKLRNFLSSNRYDIIHIHSCSCLQSALLMLTIKSNKNNKTARIIIHAHISNKGMRGLMRVKASFKEYIGKSILSNYDYFAVSPSMQAAISMFPKKQLYPQRFTIVPNAIDLDSFLYDDNVRQISRKNLNIQDKFVVGHVGRFDTPKNHVFLLNVFHKLLKKRSECVLLLVGEGELENEIKTLSRNLSLEDKIIFYGTVKNPQPLYLAMDIFLFPSLFEGLGIAGIEAQATGLPVIASDTLPNELAATHLLQWCSLERGFEFWANEIIAVMNLKSERKSTTTLLKEKGYDVSSLIYLTNHIYERIGGNQYEKNT